MIDCEHYDKGNGWCKLSIDWTRPMPTPSYCAPDYKCADYRIRCDNGKSYTNYEKIKSLSIYEMAKFLTEDPFGCNDCEEGQRLSDNPLTKDEHCDEKCYDHCLRWLNEMAAEYGCNNKTSIS